nr:sister chromatid cohesion protein pds5-like [Ipomoea batatas]GME21441.1 sister chromatid cohesion protein pds5-like [Ipomoea batatas]
MASAAPLPSQKELEQMLIQSGIELSTPPSSTAELLSLLEKVESELKSIGQDPLESTRNVLEPIKKALIERKLLRHSDKIIEVVFHQIIASLEKLHYVDSNYYSKALRVLEAVAKYKLCVRLLDFDYVLAVNVFQLFLKIISLKHTNAVLRDMVDIMSQLIEERDEVSIDFQVSILDSLRKRTLATAPCSTLLGKEVLEKCHARLKPCLLQLMTDMNMNLDDYCNVLGAVLHEVPEG